MMGSNKVLRVALGHGQEDEYKKGLSTLADDISGSIGLFFTGLPHNQVCHSAIVQSVLGLHRCGRNAECGMWQSAAYILQVLKTFEEFEDLDYARAGSQATEEFQLSEGPLLGPNGPLPHTVEPTLRKYGLPTRLKKVQNLLCSLVAQESCCNVEGNTAAAEGCGCPAGCGGAYLRLCGLHKWRHTDVKSGSPAESI